MPKSEYVLENRTYKILFKPDMQTTTQFWSEFPTLF